MLKRLLVGLVIGVVAGGALGFGLLQLMSDPMGGALGYAFAAITGVLVGLVAGKPIWAKGALVEAGLKAFVGALLACGLLLGLRYVPVELPGLVGATSAKLGYHAFGALMSVATLLSVFYEIDNNGGDEDEAQGSGAKKRVAGPSPKGPAAGAELDELEDEELGGGKERGRK